jgi:hypothetical protein
MELSLALLECLRQARQELAGKVFEVGGLCATTCLAKLHLAFDALMFEVEVVLLN